MSRTACWMIVVVFAWLVGNAGADEAAVRNSLAGYLQAFNEGELSKVAEYWADSATHLDRSTGQLTEGKRAILADVQVALEGDAPSRLSGQVEHVRMLTPSLALVTGTTTVVTSSGEPATTNFSAVMKSSAANQWQFESVEESPRPVVTTPATALQPLEWLVGSWVDLSDDVRVDTTFRWSSQQAFLIRSFAITRFGEADEVVHEGTQVIGWDANTQQIRSWKFESDGSFGEAVWSKNGSDWMVKSVETLTDGRIASGTYVLTPDGADRMTVKLIGHEIGGEPQAATPAVTMVKVPLEETPTEAVPNAAE